MTEITGRSDDMPHDRLTGIADDMINFMARHKKATGHELCVVMISDPSTNENGTGMHVMEDEDEAVAVIFIHLKAILESQGKGFAVLGNFKEEG